MTLVSVIPSSLFNNMSNQTNAKKKEQTERDLEDMLSRDRRESSGDRVVFQNKSDLAPLKKTPDSNWMSHVKPNAQKHREFLDHSLEEREDRNRQQSLPSRP